MREMVAVGTTRLELIGHVEDLCGDPGHSGFGTLLFDGEGRVSLQEDSRTWLYTTSLDSAGRWHSLVREIDLRSLECGSPRQFLSPARNDRWAVVHHAIRSAPDGPCLVLFSNGEGIRAAVADAPDGEFRHDYGFLLTPEPGWETGHGRPDGWSLEVNAAYVKISEDPDRLEFWQGYDSYHRGEKRGDLGWARLTFDKRRGRLHLVERHPGNPLDFRPEGFLCARCGGNLASDVRIGGERPFFYYVRPERTRLVAYIAQGRDPLFQDLILRQPFDRPRGNEEVIEKLQAYSLDGLLHLLYESRSSDGHWGTGLRRYRLIEN